MPTRQRALVPITIEGKTRHLRYDLNALATIEERLNLGGIGEVQGLLQQINVRSLRALIWAGLLYESPDLEEKEVGGWDIDLGNATRIIGEALSLAFGAQPEGAEGNARRPKANG